MSNKITPNEFHLLNDNPVVRTNCPQEHITEKMILDVVKFGNLVVGDRIMVQCLSHDRTELLSEREYRVTERKDEMKTVSVDIGSTRQFMNTTFKVAPMGDWARFKSDKADMFVTGKAVWNVARRVYVIEVNGEEVGFVVDKETAHRVAAGELPLPAQESEAA